MTLASGTKLGRYEIGSKLGEGGMGEVYLARDTELDRTVAIKILPASLASNQQRLQRFVQEAKAASALNHPHILTIHEIGATGDTRFIATEFIDGETLRQRISSGMKLAEIIEIAIQIAGALSAAHATGIIHRDIKPENIMVRHDGYIKVLDFGLAKLTAPEGSTADTDAPTKARVHTGTGTVMGTANYMSPEQAKGTGVDAKTDLWSLGAVLYEMVSGHMPFTGETPTETISLILQKEPAPLTRYTHEVPAELERIVIKSLTKNRDERYQTAKDLLVDLRNLKRKLELDAEIERTVPPEFRPTPSTSRGQSTPATASGAAAAAVPSVPSSAEYIVSRIKRHKRGMIIALAALLIVATTITSYLYFTRRDSIAVMPFGFASTDPNVMADPDREYLSDGITESIINGLSQLHDLKVIARSSVFRYKGKEIDPQAVGRELGVRTVLTGRIVQRGDSLTISVELVDVGDNKQIWGEKYERKISDLLSVQKEIAKEASENLRLRLTGEEKRQAAKDYTQNVEAYQLYLKGRYYWGKRTEEGLKKSIEYFNQAIEVDPNYALAYSGLADGYVVLSTYYVLPPKEAFAKAKSAAMRALEIDNNLAEAHASLSAVRFFYEWDWSNYESEARQSIQLNPNYAVVHYEYAQELAAMGRFDGAIREAKRAQELDPLFDDINTTVGWVFYFARNYDEAIKQYRGVIETNPKYFWSHRLLGTAYLQKRQPEEAVAEIQKAVALSGDSVEEQAYLGYAYAVTSQRGEAEKVIGELQNQAKRRYVSPYLFALIYVGLNEKDQAFVWLEKAYEDRSVNLIFLKVEPIFDPLRSDPRFAELLRRVGLPR